MTLLVNLSPLLLLVGFVWLALRANRKFKKASQMTPGSTQFENLVALEAYDVDETGYWRRLPWVTGLFFGVAMAFMTPLIPSTSYSPAMTAVLSFAIGGPIFGLFFPMGLRRQIRGIWAGLYAEAHGASTRQLPTGSTTIRSHVPRSGGRRELSVSSMSGAADYFSRLVNEAGNQDQLLRYPHLTQSVSRWFRRCPRT
jgi:hypothetical protein